MCRWPTSLARSIRSFGAGSHITDDICHRPSVPSFVTSIRCCGLGRCGSLSASQVIRRGQDAFLKSYPGLTRASLFTGRSHWSARSPDGSEVRRESHASFCERPGVQLLRPTHHNRHFYLAGRPNKRLLDDLLCRLIVQVGISPLDLPEDIRIRDNG